MMMEIIKQVYELTTLNALEPVAVLLMLIPLVGIGKILVALCVFVFPPHFHCFTVDRLVNIMPTVFRREISPATFALKRVVLVL